MFDIMISLSNDNMKCFDIMISLSNYNMKIPK